MMMMMMMMMMGHKSPVRVCVPRGTRTTNRDPVIEIRIEIISGVCVFHMRARVRYSNALHAHHARGRYDKKKTDTHTKTGSHRACSCRTVAMGCPYQSRHGSHDMRSIAYATRAGYTAHGCAVYGIGDVAWMCIYRACSDIRCPSTTRPMPRSPTGDRLRLCAATLLCAVDDDDDVVASREHARERTHGALRPERGYG